MATVIPVKTPAETALDEAYGGLRQVLPGEAGVRSLREDAIAKFRESGLPERPGTHRNGAGVPRPRDARRGRA